MDGGTRQTQKLDPKELLGLVALTAGRERLRPTCEMPKLELASLLQDPAIGRATPTPVGVITEATLVMASPQTPAVASAPAEPQLAKGSSGIVAMPKELLEIAHELDTQETRIEAAAASTEAIKRKRRTTPIESIKGSFTSGTDSSPRRSQPFASVLASNAARRTASRIAILWAAGGAAIGIGLAYLSLG